MIQLSSSGLTGEERHIASLREEFEWVNCVHIPRLLESSLLAFIQRRLEQCHWKSNTHGEAGNELGLEFITEDRLALHLLHFVANMPTFRALVREITGVPHFDAFRGRVYRKMSGVGHYNSWHGDDVDNRLVGLSINLSPNPYRGGLFELRNSESEEVLIRAPSTGPGDALIFKISSELEHRVTDLEGTEPKTAFAGWFRAGIPEFFEHLIHGVRKPNAKTRG